MDKAEIALLSLMEKQDIAELYISVYRSFKDLKRKHKLLANENLIAVMSEENKRNLFKSTQDAHFRISSSKTKLKKEGYWDEEFDVSESLYKDLVYVLAKYFHSTKKENKKGISRKEARIQKMKDRKNPSHHYKKSKEEDVKRKRHVAYGPRRRDPWDE